MDLAKQLGKHFRDIVFDGDFAIGTSFKKQLEDIDWQEATAKVGDHNSIAALIFHLHYYIGGISKVLKGGALEISDKYSFDMTPVVSAEGWTNLTGKFFSDSDQFASLIAQMPDEALERPFVDGKYGNYFKNIAAMIQHSYYHLGQIVLIKKLLRSI